MLYATLNFTGQHATSNFDEWTLGLCNYLVVPHFVIWIKFGEVLNGW